MPMQMAKPPMKKGKKGKKPPMPPMVKDMDADRMSKGGMKKKGKC